MKTTAALLLLTFALFYVPTAQADTFGSGANQFDIEFVDIGDPNNPADTTGKPNPAGSVPYAYRIGKFEISEQFIDEANALGGLGITMHTRRGANKPATTVTWNEAARFVNWLNLSSGSPPAYKFAIQPGKVDYDPNANIELWTSSDAGYDPNNLFRNSQARYFLPSVHEWYKAAYYDPIAKVYYDYPTGSIPFPIKVASGTAAGTAVYGHSIGDSPADTTLAGGLSPYGTMGQGGNVFEMEETAFSRWNRSGWSDRGGRGGDWWSGLGFGLPSSSRGKAPPTSEDMVRGFRVASVPEPGTMLLGALATVGLLVWRRI